MAVTNVLVVGVGGQGVLTAAEILAQAALAIGLEAKKSEVAGMAQRGGIVTSHLRFGDRVFSPLINPGEVDLLLAFELAEALRWLPWCRPQATVVANTSKIVPPVVELGLYTYPEAAQAFLHAAPQQVVAFDAAREALALGNIRLGNTLMLGAASPYLPLPQAALLATLTERFASKGEAVIAANQAAFARGAALAQAAAVTSAA